MLMKRKKIVEVKEIARLPEHVVNRVAAGEVYDDDDAMRDSIRNISCFVLFAFWMTIFKYIRVVTLSLSLSSLETDDTRLLLQFFDATRRFAAPM